VNTRTAAAAILNIVNTATALSSVRKWALEMIAFRADACCGFVEMAPTGAVPLTPAAKVEIRNNTGHVVAIKYQGKELVETC
jgi:hypothetical protein